MKRMMLCLCLAVLLCAGCQEIPSAANSALPAFSSSLSAEETLAPTATAANPAVSHSPTAPVTQAPTPQETALPTPEASAAPTEAQLRIPALYVEVKGGQTVASTEEYLAAQISVDARGSGWDSHPAAAAQIRGRGHSTWKWEKKPYKIKFDKAVSLCGMPKAKQWVLLANYADKSLSRNYVAASMAQILEGLDYTPKQSHVELYLNGEYMGVYTLSEQIQVHKNRVNIAESEAADTGYLLEIGGRDAGSDHDVLNHDYFMAGFARQIAIKAPDTKVISQEQLDFIISYVRAANDAIAAHDGYEQYIDVDSFIDWGILHELTYNIDSCYRRSCYMTKDAGGKLKMGPIWDFDLALGNFSKDNQKYNDLATVGPGVEDLLDYEKLAGMQYNTYSYDDYYVVLTWMNYLLSDPSFYARYAARWNQVKERLLEKGLEAIDESERLLEGAWQKNFERWKVLEGRPAAGYSSKKTAAIKTFAGSVDYLRDFLKQRYQWLDKRLNKGM